MKPYLDEYANYLSVVRALSENSIACYKLDLEQFANSINYDLSKLNTQNIYAFLEDFEAKTTVNRKLSSINSFLKFLEEKELFNQNDKIKRAKIARNLPSYLSQDEIQAKIALMPQESWTEKRDYAMVLFLYASGLRISECLNVELSDFDANWLRVTKTKGDKQRLVPVANVAIEQINYYLSYRPFKHKLVFTSYQENRLSRQMAFRICKRYLQTSPHTLRHSFASSLVLGGADLRVVQELLGHSSVNTTGIYTHIQKENLEKTMQDYHPISKNFGNA